MNRTVLEMRGITKEFFGNVVLKSVDLTVAEGEVHALLGENGAGKTTLMNILFGMPVIQGTGDSAARFASGERRSISGRHARRWSWA